MKSSVKKGPFEVRVTGNLLTATHGLTPIFTCSLNAHLCFVVHGNELFEQNAHNALTPFYRGNDATLLLECLNDALIKRENNPPMIRGLIAVIAVVVVLFFVAFFELMGKFSAADTLLAPVPVTEMKSPVPEKIADIPDDGWSLPPVVRALLPEKLGKAAARGIFTVPLSSGHARTLYVFADPDCRNCQRMERYFESAASQVNVVIFPVTVAGGEKALKALTPVMALPEAARATAWKQLFAADADVMVPGKKDDTAAVTNETQAETARVAIGINEVAYRAYRLPGTPWTISDDGRYVPQAVLSSPATLMEFLNGKKSNGGQ